MASDMVAVWSIVEDGQELRHPWLLQCVGGPDPTCVDRIEAAIGSNHIRPVGTSGYYSVSMSGPAAEALSDEDWVGAVAPFTPQLKLESGLYDKWQAARKGGDGPSVWGPGAVTVSIALEKTSHDAAMALFKGWETQLATRGLAVALLEKSHTRPAANKYREVAMATVSSPDHAWGAIDFLSQQPQVHWLEHRLPSKVQNHWARGIVQSANYTSTPVYSEGITGSSQILGISDTGLDLTSCFFAQTCDFTYNKLDTSCSKVIYYDCYVDCTDAEEGHGTHVAGSAAGLSTSEFTDYDGLGYSSKIAFMDLAAEDGETINTPADINTDLFGVLYDQGARVHSASWGSTFDNTYTISSQAVDQFMYDNPDAVVAIAAGNEGFGSSTVRSPSTAKNCITVGASYSAADMYTTLLGADGSVYNEDNVPLFSNWGPTADGRMKPDVMAPGSYIWSAYSAGPNSTSEHCSYVEKSGTSMATPLVAGAVALMREYFESGFYPTGSAVSSDAFTPSGALLKAMLVNSGQRLLDLVYNSTTVEAIAWPGNVQGYGRVDLGQVLYFSSGSTRVSLLQVYGAASSNSSLYASLASVGESNNYTFEATSANVGGQIKVTLVWTDPPGAVGASLVLVNDLDLSVTDPDGTSLARQNSDNLNNLEQVYIETPVEGTYTVTVTASNLSYAQPYALVMTASLTSEAAVSAANDNIDSLLTVSSNLDSSSSPGWVLIYWTVAILLITGTALHCRRGRKAFNRWLTGLPQVTADSQLEEGSDAMGSDAIAPGVNYVALGRNSKHEVMRTFADL